MKSVRKVVPALVKAARKQAGRAPRRAAATSFKRYSRAMSALGRDALQIRSAARVPIRKVSRNLYRGPALTTPEAFQGAVKRYRIKSIVSLLDPTNPKEVGLISLEKRMARKLGVKLHQVSMPFGVEPPAGSVSHFLRTVKDKAKGALYVHCRKGRDRTGTMIALFRMAREGFTAPRALAEMQRFGYNPAREPYLAYLGKFVRKFGAALQQAVR